MPLDVQLNVDSSESLNRRVPFSTQPSMYSTELDTLLLTPPFSRQLLYHKNFVLSVHKVIYTDFVDRSGILNAILL